MEPSPDDGTVKAFRVAAAALGNATSTERSDALLEASLPSEGRPLVIPECGP